MNLPQWTDVLATALVGTDRRSSTVDGPVALLDAAAALAIAQRAGFRPATGLVPADPAPDETDPVVLPAAAIRLGALLDAEAYPPTFTADVRAELLVEWLELARDLGWRAPPELLPDLLEAARARRVLRPLVAAVGGERAGWLCRQNPSWAHLLGAARPPSDVDAMWDEGGVAQRAALLAVLRDRDPAGARELLESTWSQEAPGDRAQLLEVLRVGLSLADEPLLEMALDDRRREVRMTAAELLETLPGAAYGERMTKRAMLCVSIQRDPAHAGRLSIEPPTTCGAAMQRDGILPKPPRGVGQRAWWLEEVLARTPLQAWSQFAPTPAGFLRMAAGDEWAGVLHRGVARAAATQDAGDWAVALLDLLLPQVLAEPRPDDVLLLESIYEALPAGERVARALDALCRGTGGPDTPGLDRLLELCPAPWPPDIAAGFCAHLDGLVRGRAAAWRVAERCRVAAIRLPADGGTVERLLAILREHSTPARRAIEQLVDTLQFRQEMIKELA